MTIFILVWRKSTHIWRTYSRKWTIFTFFVMGDHWPLELKFAPLDTLVTLLQRYVLHIHIRLLKNGSTNKLDLKQNTMRNPYHNKTQFTKLEVSTAFVFWENRRHETDGQTDGQTVGRTEGQGATLNAAPREDCIKRKILKWQTFYLPSMQSYLMVMKFPCWCWGHSLSDDG